MADTGMTLSARKRQARIAPALAFVAALIAGVEPLWATGPDSVADLAERLSPAVVNISTSQKVQPGRDAVPVPELPPGSPFREFFEEFFNRQQRGGQQQAPQRVSSLGSGFVIDPSGIIVTNNHVIDQADEVEVNFSDGTKLKAEVKGRDLKTDLAVLVVKPSKPLHAVKFGDSNALRVGDWVMAIGNPFGLGGSVSLGIVSARNRNINAGPYDDFIQTDAAINRGNSGGPLFNMNGEVVGINTAIISPSGGSIGIGFAIPTAIAQAVVEQLVQFGETRRGWLGVRIQDVTDDIAQSLSLPDSKGALVADVTATGPAEKAGIKPGDVIVEFDGKPVSEVRDLPRAVAETPVGKKVKVQVIRKGKPEFVEVELGRLEDGEKLAEAKSDQTPAGAQQASVLGMTLGPITDPLREQYKIKPEVKGTVVTAVEPNSPAAEKRIEPGDVITEAGEKEVTGPGDVEKRVSELKKEGRSSILLLLLKSSRNGDPHFLALGIK
ncbi:MAG: DegQ family serine endoprotease [Parvibaculaceae bacterium]